MHDEQRKGGESPPFSHPNLNIPTLARAYAGLQVYDYERPGSGMLFCIGSGLMMATMDMIPSLKYCCDLSGHRNWEGLRNFMGWLPRFTEYTAVAAWFSITPPEGLKYALEMHSETGLFVYSNVKLVENQIDSLNELALTINTTYH